MSQEASDRLERIVRRAAATFGDQGIADAWLREPCGALGGQTPSELLDSDEGAALVEQVLVRIDHGIYT